MVLQLVVESLEGIPEGVTSEYEERDGKFFLNVESAGGLEVVSSKKTSENMSKVRNERDSLKTKLRAFEQHGHKADELGDILSLVESLPEGKTADDISAAFAALDKTGGDPDRAVEERVRSQVSAALAKHEKELGKRDSEVTRMRESLHDTLVKSDISRALAEAGVTGAAAKLLAAHLAQEHVRVSEEQDGDSIRYGVEVHENDDKRYGADGSPYTTKQLVDEMRGNDEYAAFFPGSGSSGAGTTSPGQDTKSNASNLPGGVRLVGGKKVVDKATFQEWTHGRGGTPEQIQTNMAAIRSHEITVAGD